MKSIIFIMAASCIGTAIRAQGVFSNQTNNALEKVVQDYPARFHHIRGELLSSKAGAAEYTSTITVPGAVSTIITEREASHHSAVSWQSVLYSATDFRAARNRFEELFKQIKNSIIKTEGTRPLIVDGQFTDPNAENASTSILFDLLPAGAALHQMGIELQLKNTGPQWKIVLSVYDKEHADSISFGTGK